VKRDDWPIGDLETDALYWGLTPAQRVRYYGRLAEFHHRQVQRFNDKARRHARMAKKLAIFPATISIVTATLSMVCMVIG
jgi:hypothetical protein